MVTDQEDVLRGYRMAADRVMLATLGFLLLVCLGIAARTGTWASALLVGVPAFVIPALIVRMSPATLISRLAVAAAFMVFSALMIQQTQGMIEMHFGIFVLLAFLLYYRDWRPIIVAAAVIAVHHLVFYWLQSQSYPVYVVDRAVGIEIILLHAVYVVVESAMLVYLAINLRSEALEGATVATLAAAIGNGDLTVRIDAARGSSLIGAVSTMRDRLSASLGQVREQAEMLSTVAENLSGSNRHLVADSEQESQAVAAMAAAIEELTASINHLSENAGLAQRLGQQAGGATLEGGRVVQTAAEEIKGIASTIEDASRNVQLLGEKSDRVTQVVGLIKEVAGQTNLLALNAAIEAARAGEQGRGFAVVADEVRKLAERTSQATEEIDQMMAEMQGSKSATLESIQQAVSMVSQGVEKTAAVGRTIAEIAAQVAEVESAVTGISDGLREQSAAATSIAQNVERTTRLVVQTASATGENLKEIESIRESATVLHKVVSKFQIASA